MRVPGIMAAVGSTKESGEGRAAHRLVPPEPREQLGTPGLAIHSKVKN